jgi:hypothetical protein
VPGKGEWRRGYPDALLATTLEGVMLAWNHGAERTFGFTWDGCSIYCSI